MLEHSGSDHSKGNAGTGQLLAGGVGLAALGSVLLAARRTRAHT